MPLELKSDAQLGRNMIFKALANYTKNTRENPIKTKALTLVLFSILNEQIASYVSGDVKSTDIQIKGHNFTIKHALTTKVPLMAAFALFINTPFNHFGYKLIQMPFKGPMTPLKRGLQTILACLTLTPTFVVLFVGWIATINSTNWFKIYSLVKSMDKKAIIDEFKLTGENIIKVFKASYWKILRNSWIGTPLFTTLAQSFVPNELWASFFSLCYFILGTYNNTKVKLEKAKKEKSV